MSTKYFNKGLPFKVSPKVASNLLMSFMVLGSIQAVQAQTQTPSTILVSGSRFEEDSNRIPANVKVISREEIEQSSSNNIPEVLSQLGGLIVRGDSLGQLGLGATVDMGGFGATATSNTLVLVDGQRLNPIDSAPVSWESVPLAAIERIEIIQGGGSVQYGNNAVGGVINIITKDGGKNINQASLKLGSFNTAIADAVVSGSEGDTRFRLSANSSHTGGWRENSAAHANSINGRLSQSFGAGDQLFIEAAANTASNQFPGGVLGEVGQGNPRLVKFNNVGDLNQIDGSRVRLGGVKSFNQNMRFEMEASYASFSQLRKEPYYTRETNYDKYQIDITPRLKAAWGSLGDTVVGFDFNQSGANSSTNTLSAQRADLINRSFYILHRLPLGEKFELSGGARRQVQDAQASDIQSGGAPTIGTGNYSANAGDLALNYKYATGQKVYAKWNQSFRFANTDEYWGWNPNPPWNRFFTGVLKPQIAQTYEIGGDWRIGKSGFKAALFQMDTKDEIRLDLNTFNNFNDQKIRRRGVSIDGFTQATPALMFAVGGKFQRSYYLEGDNIGKSVTLVPEWSLNARTHYRINQAAGIGAVINVVGNQYYDGDNSNSLNKMPASAFADLYADYRYQSWEARFTVKNIGNAKYSTYGGYGYVYTSPTTSGNSYYYYPSDPRAFYLTVKYNFAK